MALQHARYLEVIDLAHPDPIGSDTVSCSLLRTDHLQLLRLVLPAGQGLPPHRLDDEATIQCLSGDVVLTTPLHRLRLAAGQLVAVAASEIHAIEAVAPSVLLVTLVPV